MLMLVPRVVKFGAVAIERVVAVSVDRVAARSVVEWGDAGPHVVLADVPEQRVTVTVRQVLTREDLADLRPGASGQLVVFTGATAGESGRRKVSGSGVLLSAESEIRGGEGAAGASATRVLKFVMVSSDGTADPITVAYAGAEA
jgi:hypothetical protein